MKKIILTISAAVMFFTGCQKENSLLNQNTPGFDNAVSVTFSADNECETRTLLDGVKVTWLKNDAIKVLWGNEGNSNVAYADASGETANFSATVQPAELYWSVYPAAVSSALSADALTVEVPVIQDGAFDSANIMVAATSENSFTFKHIVGLVEFSVDAPCTVEIQGAESEQLTGTVNVTGFDPQTGAPIFTVAEGANTVTMELASAGTYYAALLPDAQLKSLSIKVSSESSEEYALSANTLQMSRGKIISLGSISSRLGKSVFVTPEGTKNEEGVDVGDGKTWETAVSYKQMAMMISESGIEDVSNSATAENQNTERAAAVHDKVFYLAGGEYDTGYYVRMNYPERGTAVKLTVMGGFNPNSKGMDLSDRTSVTTFTNAASHRHFYIEGYVDMTFDGVTFYGGKSSSTSSGGAAILYRNNTGSSLTFKNCVFDSNKCTGCMGGVLQQENGKLIFDGCRFENNTAKTDGGVIYATGSADIQIRNCTFTQNSAEARAGGIYASPANITIESCTFDNCSSSNSGSSKYGGAMYLGGGSAYKISNSTIRNCSAKTYGGGIYLTSDNTLLEIENTLFENNTGKTRGGAINLGSASICKINNCSFIGNYTDKWGGALSTNTPASGIYFINNCVFTNNYCSVNQNGSAIWMRGGYLGMNNCSVYNNILEGQTLTDYPSDIRFAVTAEAGGIILNTTVLHGDSNDTGACVSDDLTYVSNATLAEGKVVLMNNAFASNSGTCVQSTTEKGYFVSKGFEYNATDCSQFSKVGDNPWFTSDALVAGAKVSDIKAMLQEEDLFSGIAKTTLGTDFLTWLNGLTVKAGNGTAVGALDYDIAGNARGESAYTPGCYQGK